MTLLKEYIRKYGRIIDNKILKVDNFLNHQIDPELMLEMGKEFKKRFKDLEINKIMTIEASGIAVGLATAYAFRVPLVFAKKKVPSTMDDFYSSKVYSFTKNTEYIVSVSKEFLNSNDRVLVIDDFLAMGNAIIGLEEIIKQAGAEMMGVGIVITKGFQEGEQKLIDKGIRVESLANIKEFKDNKVVFE